MFQRLLLGFALLGLMSGPALADSEPDEGPDSTGIGVEPEQEQENPLKKVLELMREVERRLLEANTGTGTQGLEREAIEGLEGTTRELSKAQQAQQKILEAMEGQEEAINELEQLIKMAEQQAQQQGQGSGQGKPQESGGQKPQGSAAERRQRRQQQRAQRLSPQQQEQQEENSEQARNDRRSEQLRNPQNPENPDLNEVAPDGRRWGTLPPTAQEDVASGRRARVPSVLADEWEEFLKALAEE